MKRDDGLKIIEPWPLKPDTPWWIRRRVRRLEREIDRCWVWIYRCTLAMEILAVAALVICLADCWGWIDIF